MASQAILNNQLWFSIVAVLFSIAMSIYSLYLNYKQAKVKEGIEETNVILKCILTELKER